MPAPTPEKHHERWTEDEKSVIKEHWAHIPTAEIRKAFPGRSPRAVSAMAVKLGCKKSEARLREMGLTHARRRWTKTGG